MATIEVIGVGNNPNDGTGDPLRTALIKANNNFAVLNNALILNNETAIAVNQAAVVVDSFAIGTFRSARYIGQVSNSGLNEYNVTEFLVVHDGTTAAISGTVLEATTGTDLGDFSVGINVPSGTVELSYTGNQDTNLVRINKQYIEV